MHTGIALEWLGNGVQKKNKEKENSRHATEISKEL